MNTNPPPCTIQLLFTDKKRPQEEILGLLQSLMDQRLTFTVPQPLPVFGVVSLKYDDVLLMGEVLTCQAEPTGTWRVLMQVEQRLNCSTSLLNLRR